MPGRAEYWYVLKLDGEQAMTEAKAFANAVKKEMQEIRTTANIVLKAKIDAKAARTRVQTEAEKIAAEYKKALGSAQRDFTSTASRAGAQEFTQNYRAMWEQGTVKPSAQAITSIRETEQAITDLGKTAKRMGVSTDDLVDMGGLDRAITAVQSVQRRIWGLRGLGYQLESYGRNMTTTAAAMGASIGVVSNEYLKFADPMNKAARNLDLNAELTEVLDHKLTELAGTVSMMTPEEQAQGLYLWAAATGAVVESEEELNKTLTQADQVQRLAKLGNVSYGVAVEATTDILSQYQLNVSETERVVSTLIKVAAVSKAEVSDLAQAFSFAGARSAQANTSFEDTAATLQLLSAFGLRGSRAGRGIGMLMENLIAPSGRAQKELDALLNDAFGRTDVLVTAEGQFVGLSEAVSILAEATADLTEAEKQEFVARLTSQNASRALVPLLALEAKTRERGISAIEATSNILKGQVGAQEQAFIRMMEANTGYEMSTESATSTADRYWTQLSESMSGQAEFIKASFSAAVVDVGREMTTVLLPVMKEAADLAGKLASYVSEHPGAAKMAIGATVAVGVMGLLASAVGRGIRLVADVKTVAMASSLYKTATDQIAAASQMMFASQNQLRAAGLMEMAAAEGASGSALEAGAEGLDIMGGVDEMSTLGGLGLGIGAVVGLALILKKIYEVNQAHMEEAASITQASDSYADYIAAMEEAGRSKYALTEATYDLVKARQEEQEEVDEAALVEYEKALRDAAAGALIETTSAFDTLGGTDMWAMELEDFKDVAGAVVNYLKGQLNELQIEWVKQGDLAEQVASQYHLTEAQANYLADALRKMAYSTTLPTEPMGSLAAREEEAIRESARLAGELKILEEREKAVASAGRSAALSWSDQMEALSGFYSELEIATTELERMIGVLEQVPGAAAGVDALQDKLAGLSGNMQAIRFAAISGAIEEGAKRGTASLDALADGAEKAADSAFDMFEGMAEFMTDEQILGYYDTYLSQLDAVYKAASLMNEREGQLFLMHFEDRWDKWVKGHIDAQKQITDDAEEAEKERLRQQEDYQQERERFMEQAQSGFRRLIGQALQATSVSDLDMLDTELGQYADKWDENARRMKAAMQDPMSEWRAALIPADVLAQGETAIQAYGKRWLDSFYKGMNPDAIDWAAFVQSFKDNLAAATAQENLIERAIAELAAAGISATSGEVLSALGLQSPMQQMFLGGLSTEQASESLSGTMGDVVSGISVDEGAFDSAAGTLKGSFDTSLVTKMGEINLPTMLSSMWTAQLDETPDPIMAVGKAAGALFWSGFESSVQGSTLIDFIYEKVMTSIAEALEGAT